MTLVVFPAKGIGETAPYTFNFADRLQFGEAINGASVSLSVRSGTDPNPTLMTPSPATFTGTVVTQDITGGVAGVIYDVTCTVTATNSHNYVKQGTLAVIIDAGNYLATN